MKHKKSKFTSEREPQIVTAKQLAEERGLDPDILEKESKQFSFGVTRSGVAHVNKTKYEAWIAAQIRESGIKKDKRVSYKSISETKNPGILNAIITRLTDQLKTDTQELQFLQKEVPKMTKGIQHKQSLIKMAELSKKVAGKKKKVRTAEIRLNHLLDAKLGLLKTSDGVVEDGDDSDVESDEVRFTATIEHD